MRKAFKKYEWATPNRMKFDSLHRTFNRQIDYVGSGNVISRVQHSTIVRTVGDDNNAGCPPGSCRQFDLDTMGGSGRVPASFRRFLEKHPDEKFWLYNFHFPRARRDYFYRDICWVLTDYDHTRALMTLICGRYTLKAQSIVDELKKYIVKGHWQD